MGHQKIWIKYNISEKDINQNYVLFHTDLVYHFHVESHAFLWLLLKFKKPKFEWKSHQFLLFFHQEFSYPSMINVIWYIVTKGLDSFHIAGKKWNKKKRNCTWKVDACQILIGIGFLFFLPLSLLNLYNGMFIWIISKSLK